MSFLWSPRACKIKNKIWMLFSCYSVFCRFNSQSVGTERKSRDVMGFFPLSSTLSNYQGTNNLNPMLTIPENQWEKEQKEEEEEGEENRNSPTLDEAGITLIFKPEK